MLLSLQKVTDVENTGTSHLEYQVSFMAPQAAQVPIEVTASQIFPIISSFQNHYPPEKIEDFFRSLVATKEDQLFKEKIKEGEKTLEQAGQLAATVSNAYFRAVRQFPKNYTDREMIGHSVLMIQNLNAITQQIQIIKNLVSLDPRRSPLQLSEEVSKLRELLTKFVQDSLQAVKTLQKTEDLFMASPSKEDFYTLSERIRKTMTKEELEFIPDPSDETTWTPASLGYRQLKVIEKLLTENREKFGDGGLSVYESLIVEAIHSGLKTESEREAARKVINLFSEIAEQYHHSPGKGFRELTV